MKKPSEAKTKLKVKKTPSQIGARSRRKGTAFELEVANNLRLLYPWAKRGCAQVRNGSYAEDRKADIEGTPWWIECCHSAAAHPWRKLEQAKKATDGRCCIAVVRRDREETIAVMSMADFMVLLQDIEVLRVLRSNEEAAALLAAATEKVRSKPTPVITPA